MKRYDLSKIMKRAYNLYKNARAKYQTFADALRKSWSMAKFEAKVADKIQVIEADRIRREAEAKVQRMRDEIAARKEGISYNEYEARLSRAMGYGVVLTVETNKMIELIIMLGSLIGGYFLFRKNGEDLFY